MVAVLRALKRDFSALGHRLRPASPPQPGLSTYRFDGSSGKSRAHLRIESDGSGVLFVDVSDVIHLNPSAAEFAKWALDGVEREQAEVRMIARHGRAQRAVWIQDLDSVYTMVARLVESQTGCPTCSLLDLSAQQDKA